MNRPFKQKLADYESDPTQWEVASAHTEFATRKGARRLGVSTQTIYHNKGSGEFLVRHTVTSDRGRIVDDHFRPEYKPRKGELHEQE